MPQVIITTREGDEVALDGAVGASLMETIRDNGIGDMQAMCGGCCSCATCHVYIDESFAELLLAMGPDENDLLDSSAHRKGNSRLSCQVRLTDALHGMRAEIAPED
jgi:2Fe-2S ferredoxin